MKIRFLSERYVRGFLSVVEKKDSPSGGPKIEKIENFRFFSNPREMHGNGVPSVLGVIPRWDLPFRGLGILV